MKLNNKFENFYLRKLLNQILLILLSISFLGGCGGSGGENSTSAPEKSPNLTVSPTSITVTASENTALVSILSNQNWSASSDANWLSISPSTGSGNVDINMSISTNESTAARSANISINTDSLSKVITLNQDGAQTSGFNYQIPPNNTGMRNIDSADFTDLMGVGFNIGNTMDAVGGEIAWGNPPISTQLIDTIKAAGFTAIRLPVAWSQFADSENFVIDPQWLARVDEVVSYAISQDLYVMMNIHWDGGWIQPTFADQDYVNNRLAIMWQQIAEFFRDYDDRLLFAGTNEVMVTDDYDTPTEEYYTVQNSFNQTFVTAVRATGGRNAYRQLVVQGFNTNIDHTVNFATIPEDVIANRLMMEVHFYDPFDFTLNENSTKTQWGNIATDIDKTVSDANENYVDAQFNKMRVNFHDQGIGVILGEFGVISRNEIADFEKYRVYWNEYVTQSAIENNLVPFYWDNGSLSNYSFGLFNRETATPVNTTLINAMVKANQ